MDFRTVKKNFRLKGIKNVCKITKIEIPVFYLLLIFTPLKSYVAVIEKTAKKKKSFTLLCLVK